MQPETIFHPTADRITQEKKGEQENRIAHNFFPVLSFYPLAKPKGLLPSSFI
jgi:hypothetical protein